MRLAAASTKQAGRQAPTKQSGWRACTAWHTRGWAGGQAGAGFGSLPLEGEAVCASKSGHLPLARPPRNGRLPADANDASKLNLHAPRPRPLARQCPHLPHPGLPPNPGRPPRRRLLCVSVVAQPANFVNQKGANRDYDVRCAGSFLQPCELTEDLPVACATLMRRRPAQFDASATSISAHPFVTVQLHHPGEGIWPF